MAAGQGNAMPKQRRRKAKRRSTVAAAGGSDAEDEEENPGMLLRDFMEEPAATERKATKSAARSAKAGKTARRKRLTAGSSDEGETDLLSLGQVAPLEESEEAGASAKLIGAISTTAPSRASATMRPRHAEEALPENEFHAGATGEEITVEDLLAPLAESTGFGDVKKLLQGMSKKEAMPEPVSEVKQGREERQTRYDASCNDVKKFIPQLQRMRKADQVTLGEENDLRPSTTASLVGSFRPLDDFEKELEEVTKAAGATEADLIDHKGLPMNPRIRNEQQTQQVARLKVLMLRQQQASKRMKKIKSKTYRRIHRKSEHREREVLLERLERENPELAKSLRQDYEKKHAERRLQRSKNARKKWAQTMQRFAKGDQSAAKEITKQAQDARDEQQALRRAIQGKDPDQSEDSEAMDLSDSDGDGNGGRKQFSQRTVDKAKNLTLNELNDLKNGGELPTTGLLGLSFMRNAIKQKRTEAKADAQSMLNELEGLGARLEAQDAADSDAEDVAEKSKAAQGQPRPAPVKKREFTAEELERASKEVDAMLDQEDVTQAQGMSVSGPLTVRGVVAQKLPPQTSQGSAATSSRAPATTSGASKPQAKRAGTSNSQGPDKSNPWLANTSEENPWLATEPEASADAAANSALAAEDKKARRKEDRKGPKGAAASAEPGSRRKRRRSNKEPSVDGVASDAEAEAGESIPSTSAAELLNVLDADAEAARQQRDLVRATFVEGTQAEDFDEEKDEKLREEEEKDKPSVLLGWGDWTGEGVKPRPAPKSKGKGKGSASNASKYSTPKPPHVQHYEGDGALKAQAKYFVDKVPFPFKNPQQYDQEMRMPSGPEWNTLTGHLQRVKPKFFMKVGAIVPPLQYVKHLPPEQKESAINTWASSKQPKRLKARF